ncbi:arylsulfatase J-like, partial [Lingula anatina]|uniref:Arylsulfatase J-like n=1 Tax=Lingula anatina TaxID=7574 RepID=A0A1S3HZK0_LINAN
DTSQRASLRRGDWKIITGSPALVIQYIDGEPVELEIIGIDPSIQNVSFNKNVWLYNITKDPYEQYDVSEKYPDVVRLLLDRLEAIRQMAPLTICPDPDPALNAALQNGVWGPAVYPTSGSISESANHCFWICFFVLTALNALV